MQEEGIRFSYDLVLVMNSCQHKYNDYRTDYQVLIKVKAENKRCGTDVR
jgi:hypothetical protein